jgi:hypothetical protein
MTDPNQPTDRPAPKRVLRAPSARLTAALAAAMLAVGVAIGAAIGPAPSASLGQGLPLPLPVLLPRLLAAAGVGRQQATTPTTTGPPIATPATSKRKRRAHPAATSTEPETTSTTETSTPSSSSTSPKSTAKKKKKVALPPITNVWLIELSGSTFEGALAAPTAAPYTDSQAVPTGTLLSGYSALDASALASDAALLASTPPQTLDTIVQPPCTEGAAAEPCLDGTPTALAAADSFLQQTLPTITSTAAYRASGLVVITFGSVAAPTAAGLPAGSATATLTATPPAGALLISPFVTAGNRSSTAFDPSSPTQSLERLLHK